MAKTKQINLNDEEREVLREYHEKKKKKLLAELNAIDSKISLYKDDNDKADKSQIKLVLTTGYDKSLSLPKKAVVILKELNRVATVNQVFDRLAQYEPELKKDKKIAKTKTAHLYGAVAEMAKKNQYVFRFKEDDIYKVGLLEWRDSSGSIKESYK